MRGGTARVPRRRRRGPARRGPRQPSQRIDMAVERNMDDCDLRHGETVADLATIGGTTMAIQGLVTNGWIVVVAAGPDGLLGRISQTGGRGHVWSSWGTVGPGDHGAAGRCAQRRRMSRDLRGVDEEGALGHVWQTEVEGAWSGWALVRHSDLRRSRRVPQRRRSSRGVRARRGRPARTHVARTADGARLVGVGAARPGDRRSPDRLPEPGRPARAVRTRAGRQPRAHVAVLAEAATPGGRSWEDLGRGLG